MARRLSCVVGVAAALLLWGVSAAQAQQAGSVTYEVTFEEVTDNCPQGGMSLNGDTVRIAAKGGKKIAVSISGVPTMNGTRGRGGKFKAEARGPAAIEGASGKFSVGGRANESEIQILFIVEYYRGKKPLCTQSWSAAGKRKR
jgi:hypothetical protein